MPGGKDLRIKADENEETIYQVIYQLHYWWVRRRGCDVVVRVEEAKSITTGDDPVLFRCTLLTLRAA